MIEVTFPDSTSADANRLARQLRRELADSGAVPNSGMDVRRANSENMDAGSIMQIVDYAVAALVAGHAVRNVAETIMNFAVRNHRTVVLDSELGKFNLPLRLKQGEMLSS
jgi:hypothetical protein